MWYGDQRVGWEAECPADLHVERQVVPGVAWWRHQMETFSALLAICAGNSPVTGEFPAQRPVTRNFDVFFGLCMNKRLSKQSSGWWFGTPSRQWWRHCNGFTVIYRICVLWNKRNFRHCLHRKLSFWQLTVQPMTKISPKWHFHFSVRSSSTTIFILTKYISRLPYLYRCSLSFL